jgi:hypothetical protein
MLERYPARKSFDRLCVPGFEEGVRLAIHLPKAAALWTDGGDVVALASHPGHLGTVRTFSRTHISEVHAPRFHWLATVRHCPRPLSRRCCRVVRRWNCFLRFPTSLRHAACSVQSRASAWMSGPGTARCAKTRKAGAVPRCCSNTTRAAEMGISLRSAFKLSSMSKSSPLRLRIPRSWT